MRTRRPQRRTVGIAATAALLTGLVAVLTGTRGNDAALPPVEPSPSPTPSVTYEAPRPSDHPIGLYEGGGALTLVTIDRLERVGTATLWRKDPGGWRRLGTLEHTIPPEQVDPGRTHLSRGPGNQDLVALHLAGGRVGFSRDGGATWRYLARPAGCAAHTCSGIVPTTDYLYVDNRGAALRAAFGATAWEEIPVPRDPGSRSRYVGLLVLEDDLLNIDSDCDRTTNHYWVSRDHGDTWSRRRDLPPGTCIYGSVANVPYTADVYETQWWRSRDLVHWEHATSPYDERSAQVHAACPASLGKDPVTRRYDEPPVRIGDDVYKLFLLSRRDGRELELKVSHDRCRTWQRVLR